MKTVQGKSTFNEYNGRRTGRGILGKVPFILTGKRLISISPQMRLRLVLGLCIRNWSMFTHLSVAYNIFADRLPMTKYKMIDKKKAE